MRVVGATPLVLLLTFLLLFVYSGASIAQGGVTIDFVTPQRTFTTNFEKGLTIVARIDSSAGVTGRRCKTTSKW